MNATILIVIAVLTIIYPTIEAIKKHGPTNEGLVEWIRNLPIDKLIRIQALFLFAFLLIVVGISMTAPNQ